MLKRVLLCGLVAAGLLAGVGPSEALSKACRTATSEVGGADISRGHASYLGDTVAGLPTEVDESGLVAETDRSSGTLTAWMEFGPQGAPAKACPNLTYTVYVLDTEDDLKLVPEERVVLASSSTPTRANDGFRLEFTVDVPEHAGTCVHVYATVTNGANSIDRAPDVPRDADDPTYNTPCAHDDGGGGGSQYWN